MVLNRQLPRNRPSYNETMMRVAEVLAQRSSANKRQVGAIAVLNKCIIADGYNGTAPGKDNTCEDENNKTIHEKVIHAEENMCRKGVNLQDATVYVSTAPCRYCAFKLIYSGVKKVFYREEYKNDVGLNILRDYQIRIVKLDREE